MSDPYTTCPHCGVVERSVSLLEFKHRNCRPVSVEWNDPASDPLADIQAARDLFERRSDLEFRGLSPADETVKRVMARMDELARTK